MILVDIGKSCNKSDLGLDTRKVHQSVKVGSSSEFMELDLTFGMDLDLGASLDMMLDNLHRLTSER